MSLLDILSSPWAILPDRLFEMQSVYATHLRGEKIDIAGIEARLGRPLHSEQQQYAVRDGGVAVLVVAGFIAPKANMFTRVSGGVSAEMLQQQIASMAADSRVRSVVLDVDSPGGSVLGIPAAAAAVRELAAAKPTVAVSTGIMASAAYWVGSAANAVYVSGLTDHVGSIGVVATHNYSPRADGGQTTEITAGRYKRLATDAQPLNSEGAAYMQAMVDEVYRVFVDAVATHRGTSAERVLEHMADGRLFIGEQAIAAGLADGVATVDAMVAELAANPERYARRRAAVFGAQALAQAQGAAAPAVHAHPTTLAQGPAAGVAAGARVAADGPVSPAAANPPTPTKGRMMTPRDTAAAFAADNPDAAELLRADGAAAEHQRMAAVRAHSLPGHEALVEQLAADGRTTGAEAAALVLAAERASRTAAAAAFAADAPRPVPASSAAADEPESDKQSQVEQAKAYARANGCDFIAALKALGFAA